MEERTLDIPVVWPDYFEDCGHCTGRLQEMLEELDGVRVVSVDPENRAIGISYDTNLLTFEDIKERARALGVSVAEHFSHQTVRITGLDCPDCAHKLETAIRRISGVAWASLNYATSVLIVEYEPDITSLDAVIERVRDFGYEVERERIVAAPEPRVTIRRNLRLACTAASGALLAAGGIVWLISGTSTITAILFLLSAIIGGIFTARTAALSLRGLVLDTNLLVTVAAIGAIALREYAEAGAVMFLFSLGGTLEAYTVDKTRKSIMSLIETAPSSAMVRRNGSFVSVDVHDIEVGETVLVKPGDKIPVDGTIVEGESTVDQSPITGESAPVAKGPGDVVYAGTINGRGSFEARSTSPAEDNTLSRIINMVEQAQSQRAPAQRFSETFGRYYTPSVIGLAVVVAIVGPLFMEGGYKDWFSRALTLLVVSCPCALVISTPVAIVAAIGNAAKSGVLIRGGAHLEMLGNVTIAAFDKTGTLTQGKLSLCGVIPFNSNSADDVLAIAAAIESRSEHPLADAIIEAARNANLPERKVQFFEAFPGKGARAVVEGEAFYIGSTRFMRELGIDVPGTTAMAEMQVRGCSVVYLADDKTLRGAIGASDTLKPNSADAISKLKQVGIRKTVMLTGDTAQSGRAIAGQLGIDEEHAELLPEDKLRMIRELGMGKERVAMVGDGINDSPALAAADVGIAMGGAGTPAAIEAADVALMADDIAMLPYAISLSKRARSVIIQNITLSLLVVVLLVFGALTNKISLAIGVLGHEGSALLVIANSMRLLKRNASI
ncbi:MAG: heavy metal translocating P-type ATPase [Armatimonadota bacterium]